MKRVTIQELAHNVLKLPRLSIPLLKNTLDAYRTSISPLKPADVVAQHLSHLDAFLASSANSLQSELVQADKLAEEQGKANSYLETFYLQQHLTQRNPLEVYANRSIVLQKNALGNNDKLTQCEVAAYLSHGIAQWIRVAQTHGVSLSWIGAVSDASVPIAELNENNSNSNNNSSSHNETSVNTENSNKSSSMSSEQLISSAATTNPIPVDLSPLLTEFGRSRIPGKEVDEIVTTPLSELEHVIVLHDGHPYLIRVFDDHHNVVSLALLKKTFEVILSITPDQDNTTSVSVLTAGNRTLWGQTYQELIKTPENATTLELFAKSIIVICLDSKGWESKDTISVNGSCNDESIVHDNNNSNNNNNNRVTTDETNKDQDSTIASAISGKHRNNNAQIASMHGGVEEVENRWYDKHQLIISADGNVAFNFEPSLSDRIHWAKWIGDVLAIVNSKGELAQFINQTQGQSMASSSSLSGITENVDASLVSTIMRPLSVTYGKTFASHIRTARQEATTLAADTEVHTIHIPIGKKILRSNGLRAGALVQMCVQLAEYNLRDKISASAEECSTAAFFHGLTESARVATVELQHVVERLSDIEKAAHEHHEVNNLTEKQSSSSLSALSTSPTSNNSTVANDHITSTTSSLNKESNATNKTVIDEEVSANTKSTSSSSIPTETATSQPQAETVDSNNTRKVEEEENNATVNKIENSVNIITNNGNTPRVSTSTKEELTQHIKSAVRQHVALTDAARSGNGIDGHLGALHQLATQRNDSAALAFFNDDVYKSTSTYSFYASQMSLPWMRYFVIGPVSSNGYGLGYVVDDHEIRLTISALSSNPATSMTDMEIAILHAANTIANTLGIPTETK